MDSDSKTMIFLAGIFLIIGILLNVAGVAMLNSKEVDLSTAPDPDEYKQREILLNNTKRTSRMLNVFGNIVIILGGLLIVVIYLDDINKKVESLQLEINSLKYRKEIEHSIKTNNEKKIQAKR